MVRGWESGDRKAVERLLRLLAADAAVTADDAPVYVAEAGGRVAGMVTLCVFTTLTGRKAFLDHLVVDPGFRRRGIGRELVRYAIVQAQNAGATRIDLTANTSKRAGRALYESLGFHERDTGCFRLPLQGQILQPDNRGA